MRNPKPPQNHTLPVHAALSIDFSKYIDNKHWGWHRMVLDTWREHVARTEKTRVLEIGAFDGVSANLMLDLIFPHPESEVHTAVSSFKPNGVGMRVSAGEGRGDETILTFENLRTPHERRESTD